MSYKWQVCVYSPMQKSVYRPLKGNFNFTLISHRRAEEKLFTIFPEFVSLSFELLKPRSRLRRESDCYVNTGTQYTHTHTQSLYTTISHPVKSLPSRKEKKRGKLEETKPTRKQHEKESRERQPSDTA